MSGGPVGGPIVGIGAVGSTGGAAVGGAVIGKLVVLVGVVIPSTDVAFDVGGEHSCFGWSFQWRRKQICLERVWPFPSPDG